MNTPSTSPPSAPSPQSLRGVRIISLALNMPGPAAMMRLRAMGADCLKVESPAGDPMGHYNQAAYAQMHEGIEVICLDLKSESGLLALRTQLTNAQVLLTSFRPSALHKLGLDWQTLQAAYPQLSMVSIVGSPGLRAEEPGHDLTYLAENGLVNGLDLPATLYADMAGSLMACEAVLQAVLLQRTYSSGSYVEVALSDAAATLALPRTWGLTLPHGAVGGAHAGYRVYPCLDGRVAVAALEPHFAMSLCSAAGIDSMGLQTMLLPTTHSALTAYFAQQTCQQLGHLALTQDIPLYCMPHAAPTLFDPVQVGDLHLANRIAMAPLTRNRAPGAVPTPLMAEYYRQRASAGLLITEATAISHQGQGYSDVPGLYGTDQLNGWKAVTQAVHQAGGKIVVQLWHVGRVSHTSLQPDGGQPVAPSAITAKTKTVLIHNGVPSFVETSAPRALATTELSGVVHSYQAAARNAVQKAGFDGVEIHAANGYLIDQFLKTGSNQRTDGYGGSIENRARLLLEVVLAVIAAISGARTGIRLSPVTPANDAYDADPQALFEYVVRQLAPLHLAYIHIIEGSTGGPRTLPDRPFDYAALQFAYRQAGGKGAWMVNNGLDKALAEQAIGQQAADLVAFGRPYIANPDLVERLRRNGPYNEGDRSTYYGGDAKGYTDYPFLAK